MRADKEIKLIEKILGHGFGERPRIVQYTWKNYFQEYVYAKGYTPKGYLQALAALAFQPYAGYIHQTRTCLIPRNDAKDKNRFVTIHELMHCYVRNNCPEFKEKKETAKEQWERRFLKECISEGICDYVAISADKALNREGMQTEDSYGILVEYWLAGYDDLNPAILPRTVDMNSLAARQLLRDADSIRAGLWNKDQVSANIREIVDSEDMRSILAHKIGYHIIRSLYDNSAQSTGTVIDWLIANQYESFEEVTTKVPIFR